MKRKAPPLNIDKEVRELKKQLEIVESQAEFKNDLIPETMEMLYQITKTKIEQP